MFFSASVRSPKDILSLSILDVQKLLHLSKSDVQHVFRTMATVYRTASPVTGKSTTTIIKHSFKAILTHLIQY